MHGATIKIIEAHGATIKIIESHGVTIKIIEAQQTKICNTYKNIKLKLLKTNAVWFNKMCRIKHLKPNYV